MSGKCAANGKKCQCNATFGIHLVGHTFGKHCSEIPNLRLQNTNLPRLQKLMRLALDWHRPLMSTVSRRSKTLSFLHPFRSFQLFVYIYCFYEMTQIEVIVFATIQNLISHFITMISPFYKSVRRGTVLQNSHKVQAAICHKAMMLQKAGRGSNGPNLEIQSGERTLNSFPETCPDSIHHPPLSIPLLSVRPTSPSWWSLSPSSPVQKVFRMIPIFKMDRCINTFNLFQSL